MMNKYEEALDELSYPLEDSICGGCKCGESDCSCEKRIAVETLQELVDRATPKKVIINQYTPAYCQTCGEELSESLGDGYYEYYTHLDVCPNKECRQVLDWSDE